MPETNKEGFDQLAYIESWKKENMLKVSASYKKEFVQQFRDSCAKLGIKQSDVFRQAMQDIIEKASQL